MQFPQYSQEEPCSCQCRSNRENKAKASRLQPPPLKERPANLQKFSSPNLSIIPVLKRKGSQEKVDPKKTREAVEEDPLETNGIEIMEDTSVTSEETDPSWSMGCLYR